MNKILSIILSLTLLFSAACKNDGADFRETFRKALGVPMGNLASPMNSQNRSKSVSPSEGDLLSQQNSIPSCPEDSTIVGKAFPAGKSQWCAYKDKKGLEVKHGEFRLWHQNGNIKIITFYQDGEIDGKYREWYDNKKLKELTPYLKGRKHGKSVLLNQDGKILEETNYANNEKNGLYKKFSRFNKPLERGSYSAGLRSGTWEFYDNNGQLKERTEFRSGAKHGKTNKFGRNSQLLASGYYDRDQEIGHWIYFNNKGQKSSEGNLILGKKHGKWIDYNSSGIAIRANYFDNGRRTDSIKLNVSQDGTPSSFGSRDILGAEPPRKPRSYSNYQNKKPKNERPRPLTKEGWSPL